MSIDMEGSAEEINRMSRRYQQDHKSSVAGIAAAAAIANDRYRLRTCVISLLYMLLLVVIEATANTPLHSLSIHPSNLPQSKE